MAPEILTEILPQKESNYSLRNSTALQGRSIKTVMYGSETISRLGPKIWDILRTEFKKLRLLNYSKRKFVSGSQKIVHVVYVKKTYRKLDFCKLPVRKYFYLKYFIHVKESVEAVIDSKPYTP